MFRDIREAPPQRQTVIERKARDNRGEEGAMDFFGGTWEAR